MKTEMIKLQSWEDFSNFLLTEIFKVGKVPVEMEIDRGKRR